MDDLTRGLARRIGIYRTMLKSNRSWVQQLHTTNHRKISQLASAMGHNPGANREANWDSLIAAVIGLRARNGELRDKLRNSDPAHRIDAGTLTDTDIAHLIEQGWTAPAGTRAVYCKKGPYDCWAPAGHDGNCVPSY